LPSEYLEHLIYAPVPNRGYRVRATSPGVTESEFLDAAKGYFAPFDQNLFDGDLEARMVIGSASTIYLSRILQRPRLDELKRSGVVCHMVEIPIAMFSAGLTFREVNNAMVSFESSQHEVPKGNMPELPVKWESKGDNKDYDLTEMASSIPEDAARRIIMAFNGESPRVFVLSKTGGWSKRTDLVYAISKFLILCGIKSFSVTSECPIDDIMGFEGLVVVSSYIPSLSGHSGWTVVNLSNKEKQAQSPNAARADDVIRGIYS